MPDQKLLLELKDKEIAQESIAMFHRLKNKHKERAWALACEWGIASKLIFKLIDMAGAQHEGWDETKRDGLRQHMRDRYYHSLDKPE